MSRSSIEPEREGADIGLEPLRLKSENWMTRTLTTNSCLSAEETPSHNAGDLLSPGEAKRGLQ